MGNVRGGRGGERECVERVSACGRRRGRGDRCRTRVEVNVAFAVERGGRVRGFRESVCEQTRVRAWCE